MIKIINAFYGNFYIKKNELNVFEIRGENKIDVADILRTKIKNNKLEIHVGNNNFTDPCNGVVKELYVKYEYDNKIIETIIGEGDIFKIPEINKNIYPFSTRIISDSNKTEYNNILLLTSCNRIKQVLLSLSLNAQTIKNRFSVIIADNSTPDIGYEAMCGKLDSEDPYNQVKEYNYCSDIELLYNAHQYFPNIDDFKIIHNTPRLPKQMGEAILVALGLMQASLFDTRKNGSINYCLKLTGTSILKYDILSELQNYLKDYDIITWHRANIGKDERSTRIFGCNPNVLSALISKTGWNEWCDERNGFFEQRFAKLIEKEMGNKIYYTRNDENGLLLEGGMSMQKTYGREKILKFINENNIDTNATPYLIEFMNGGIW